MTILKELAQSIEPRCEKWSTKVAEAIAEELKQQCAPKEFITGLMTLLYNREEVNKRSNKTHMKIANEDRGAGDLSAIFQYRLYGSR